MSRLFPGAEVSRRRRDALLALLFALALALLVARAARKQGGVLERNQAFGARFLAGADPYFDPALGHRLHGPYPPSLALVAAPLALLPEGVARVAWALAQVAALVRALAHDAALDAEYWPSLAVHARRCSRSGSCSPAAGSCATPPAAAGT
jgi:hypothetical protein